MMKLDYIYSQTSQIKKDLQKLEVVREIIDLLPYAPAIEENFRRQSLLKSSLFSARIEGNKLKLTDLSKEGSKSKRVDIQKLEVFNILKALRWLYSSKIPKRLSLKTVLKFHQLVMSSITQTAGQLRRESSAIFNQAGIAIYVCPPPQEVKNLLQKLIDKMNKSSKPGPAKAAICHFAFEKIHPFLDGNGRVGRLIATFILKNSGFGFRGLVSLEEYLENNRQTYYDLLARDKKNITEFVEFFLQALLVQAQKTIEKFKNIKNSSPENLLLPRRREILAIIRDHELVSFDFLKRRFVKIPVSTLHYDLKQLVEKDYIVKCGTTRGVVYEPRDKG